MDALVHDDVLRGMFAELAESVDVPPSGAASALAAIASADRRPATVTDLADVRASRRKRLGTLIGVAAAVAIVAGIGVTARDGSDHHAGDSSSSATAAPAIATATGGAAIAGPVDGGASAPAQQVLPSAAASAAAAAEPRTFQGQAGAPAAAPAARAPTAASRPKPAVVASASVPGVDSDRVIRTGDVDLVVAKGTVPATVSRLEGLSAGLGGFLQDSSSQQADPKSGGVPTASVTLRVPAAQFEALLRRVQALGTVVTSTTTGQDVTSQYVDLAARLKALQTSRETYLVILSKAATVSDTLAVQQRLDDLQQQIEQLQGQQNQLGAQSDLATLTVETSEPTPKPVAKPKPKPPAARSGLSQALRTAGDRFRRGSEAVVAALGTVALLLIAGVLVLIAGRFGRRAYRRHTV